MTNSPVEKAYSLSMLSSYPGQSFALQDDRRENRGPASSGKALIRAPGR